VFLKLLYQFIAAATARPRELNRWAASRNSGTKSGSKRVLLKGDSDVIHKNFLASAIVILTTFVAVTRAAEFPPASEIIKTEGQFVFTDGSSYYMFKKDGTFTSEPLEISGREITGTWELRDERVFVIRGRWMWINGLSPRDDYRQMRIAIYRPTAVETVDWLSHTDATRNVKVYKCYFVIEELIKIAKPSD
jgi:hypothetical protein